MPAAPRLHPPTAQWAACAAWNRLCREGARKCPEWPPRAPRRRWRRPGIARELSLALSEDEGETWTRPVIVAREPGAFAYPYLFERRPGELWLFTRYTWDRAHKPRQLRVRIDEAGAMVRRPLLERLGSSFSPRAREGEGSEH